jgi:hypothetical protein
MEMNGQLHVPAALSPGEIAAGTHWLGGWVSPRAGLDAVEKGKILTLPGFEPGPSSPSLYRVSYPDSSIFKVEFRSFAFISVLYFLFLALFNNAFSAE